jgi:nucleotide-binding universal stress UspA family protein
MNPTGTVVVGVDGSPESGAAVEFALREAMRRQTSLRVVAAAQLPEYWTVVYGTAGLPSPHGVVDDAKRHARHTVGEVVNAHPELAAVGFMIEAPAGPPGPVLVEASEGADMLVLGHRGLGAVRSAMLGSVGLHCVLHATCPVTVVRPAAVTQTTPVAANAMN